MTPSACRLALTLMLALPAAACSESPGDRASGAPADGAAFVLTERTSEPLPARLGIGRDATEAEIAAVDVDIMPDGRGLPAGSGGVGQGASIYAEDCAICHGAELEGTPLAGRLVPDPDHPDFPDGAVAAQYRTVGNYWPYATTLFDYIRRAMPFDRPGTMTDEEVYAVSAYILWRNGIVAEDAVMDARTLAAVVMPARDRFVPDDRLESDRVR